METTGISGLLYRLGRSSLHGVTELASPALVAESPSWRAIPNGETVRTCAGPTPTISPCVLIIFMNAVPLVSRPKHWLAICIMKIPGSALSGEQAAWRRTRAALLSVLESPDQDGNARMAFAPLAGSLGSGFTSMALYQRQTSVGFALRTERTNIQPLLHSCSLPRVPTRNLVVSPPFRPQISPPTSL